MNIDMKSQINKSVNEFHQIGNIFNEPQQKTLRGAWMGRADPEQPVDKIE